MAPWTRLVTAQVHESTSATSGAQNDKMVNMAAIDIGPGPSTATRLGHVGFTLFAFILMLIILPIAIPVMLIFRIYRAVLRDMIQDREGNNVAMVSGDDSVWLQDSPENRAVINALMIFKGVPNLKKMSTVFSERLVQAKDPKHPSTRLFPKVTRYATKILRRYVWYEDPEFDVKNHVFLHPVAVSSDREDLERVVGEICSSPLPPYRPGWQFIILSPPEGDPDYGARYRGVMRVHHSIADGISLIRTMMQIIVDERPDPRNARGDLGSKARLKMLWRAIFEGPGFIIGRVLQQGDRNILHGPNISGTKLVSWSDPIDLNLVKNIKTATGTTVNDVIMSCLASTFRDYFKEHTTVVPPHIQAYIPVNIRPVSSALTLDNQFAVVLMSMPLEDDDLLKTLKKTKSRMDDIKNSPEPIVNAYTVNYCMSRFPNWLSKMFFDWVSTKSSLIVSNVPGPQERLSVAGSEIEGVVFWPPQKSNVGMGASVFSYNGTIRLGIYVDKSVMTNPKLLVEGFNHNVHKLINAIKLE